MSYTKAMNQPETQTLQELVQRIQKASTPLRVLLFGSGAKGVMGAQSDLDVLVVVPEGTHKRKTAQDIHRKLVGFRTPVDVIVATPDILEKHKDTVGLIYKTALAQGREIYAAAKA
ncbi:MAG: nucleotidyltransferase domain-containing protein [Thermodesulfobacteriota bacterium]|nr:nucleotidyltransferase domain-containing protein [Thermodesulfobacteriota bacterium]